MLIVSYHDRRTPVMLCPKNQAPWCISQVFSGEQQAVTTASCAKNWDTLVLYQIALSRQVWRIQH
eukprot:2701578-Ditylum_brightwellii.AAC.1